MTNGQFRDVTLCVCACVRARACACVYIYIYTYTYIHTYTHTYIHNTYIHIYIYTYRIISYTRRLLVSNLHVPSLWGLGIYSQESPFVLRDQRIDVTAQLFFSLSFCWRFVRSVLIHVTKCEYIFCCCC